MLIAIFIVLCLIALLLSFLVFEPILRRSKAKNMSEQDKERQKKVQKEIENFLTYTGDKQD